MSEWALFAAVTAIGVLSFAVTREPALVFCALFTAAYADDLLARMELAS